MNQPNAMKAESPAAKIKWAKVSDFTGYDSTSGMNGGKYGFWEEYHYIGEGRYRHTYHTTASGFSFCECCGSFQGGCCDHPETVDEQVVWTVIKAAENDPSDDVYAEYDLFQVGDWLEKLRRRVRDSLNKTTNDSAIIACAIKLDVKME